MPYFNVHLENKHANSNCLWTCAKRVELVEIQSCLIVLPQKRPVGINHEKKNEKKKYANRISIYSENGADLSNCMSLSASLHILDYIVKSNCSIVRTIELIDFELPFFGVQVAHWIKRWPADLAVPGSSPARSEIFSTVNGVPLHIAFHNHPPIILI